VKFFGVAVEYEWTLSDPLRGAKPTSTREPIIKGSMDIWVLMENR